MKKGLYRGIDAEFYDELLDGEIDDYHFWRSLVDGAKGSSLEVGCGTGRILLPLLKEGYAVDGIDSSAHMVRIFQQKADELGLESDVRVQLMQKLAMGKTYPLIFIPCFSIQLVDSRASLKQALKKFHAHLDPGGQLAISMFFPWEEMEEDEPGEWRLRKKIKRKDGTRLECRQTSEMDMNDQTVVLKNRYSLFDKTRKKIMEEIVDVPLIWFYPHEFHLLLEETGFELRETYSDFKFEPLDDFTPHAVFLAEKV